MRRRKRDQTVKDELLKGRGAVAIGITRHMEELSTSSKVKLSVKVKHKKMGSELSQLVQHRP